MCDLRFVNIFRSRPAYLMKIPKCLSFINIYAFESRNAMKASEYSELKSINLSSNRSRSTQTLTRRRCVLCTIKVDALTDKNFCYVLAVRFVIVLNYWSSCYLIPYPLTEVGLPQASSLTFWISTCVHNFLWFWTLRRSTATCIRLFCFCHVVNDAILIIQVLVSAITNPFEPKKDLKVRIASLPDTIGDTLWGIKMGCRDCLKGITVEPMALLYCLCQV